MGIACSIFRDNDGDIIRVEAPNGNSSILYKDLNTVTGDKETALDLWAYSYSDEFNSVETTGSRDVNGEHLYSTVVKNVENSNNLEHRIGLKEATNVLISFRNAGKNSIKSLYNELNKLFFKNGIFTLNKKELSKTTLYSDSEVSRILNNKDAQQTLKNSIAPLASANLNDENTSNLDGVLGSENETPFSISTGEYSDFGKEIKLNPHVVEKEVALTLAGIKTEEELLDAASNITHKEIYDRIMNDKAFRKFILEKYSNYQKVPVLMDSAGAIIEKPKNNTSFILKNNIRLGNKSYVAISEDVSFLNNISQTVWNNNSSEVKNILKNIVLKAAEIGIDVVGLDNTYNFKTRDEILTFINELKAISSDSYTDSLTDENIDLYANISDAFFNLSRDNEMDVIDKDDVSAVKLRTYLDEVTLFREHNLVSLGNNMYQKVEKLNEDAYEVLYEAVLNDPTVLPEISLYPAAFDTNSKFSLNKLKSPSNKENIKNSIKKYVEEKAKEYIVTSTNEDAKIVENIIQFKLAFGFPIISERDRNVPKSVEKAYSNFNGKLEYLTTSYPSDLYREVLKEKAKNSDIYKYALKSIGFDDNKLYLKDNDEQSKDSLRALIPYGNSVLKEFVSYSKVVRDKELNDLFPDNSRDDNDFKAMDFLRRYYQNNPNLLSEMKGTVNFSNGLIVTKASKQNFIKVNGIIYQKISQGDKNAFYSPLSGIQSSEYYNLNEEITVDDSSNNALDDLNAFSPIAQEKAAIKIQKMLSDDEAKEISDTIDRCS